MRLVLLLLHTIELWVKLVYGKPVYLLSTTISRRWFDAASILLMQVEAARQADKAVAERTTSSCLSMEKPIKFLSFHFHLLLFFSFLLWSV